MSVLMIGATEREKIKRVIERAKKRPMPLSRVREGAVDDTSLLKLEDRKPGFVRPRTAQVDFPGGYRAAFSIEEQPAGLCTHLSVGVENRSRKGMMPSEEAVKLICKEFGVPFPANGGMWIEEYEPGEYAINLVSVYAPAQEGNA